MPDTCQAVLFDQTQLVLQLEGIPKRLGEAALRQERIPAEEPVAGQAGGRTEQQVEVQIRAQGNT
ncbi:hypothetical protein D1872_346280 [compost metagenome]